MSNAAPGKLRTLIEQTFDNNVEIAELLRALPVPEKIATVRSLSGATIQAKLWKRMATQERLRVSDLIPPDYKPMKPVVFHGKNSLPAFSSFQKICCRPPAGKVFDELWGYNETPLKGIIGPGYFVVHETRDAPLGGIGFDYTRLPSEHPPGWPEIQSNSGPISRLVYGNMVDYMRRVSDHVFIGCATRHGREIGSYFIIVREI
jgi:hypothetical protein